MAVARTARRIPIYRGPAYWERERPEEVLRDKVALAFYRLAGKLQLSVLYRDPETKEKRRGKTDPGPGGPRASPGGQETQSGLFDELRMR